MTNLYLLVIIRALPAVLLALFALCSSLRAERKCQVVLFSGEERNGKIGKLLEDRLHVAGQAIAYHEVQQIRFGAESKTLAGEGLDREIARRPFLQLVGGEIVFAKVLEGNDKSMRFLLRGRRTEVAPAGEELGVLQLPLSAVNSFRLREAHSSDDNFEKSLVDAQSDETRASEQVEDRVFVRKGAGLLRVEGLFQGIDAEFLRVEYRDKKQRLRRNRVQGAILSRVAGTRLEKGYEGTLWLSGGSRMPVILKGIEDRDGEEILNVEVHGSPWSVALSQVQRVTFDSNRIQFLSDLDPVQVEESALFDGSFPYRRDLSVGGEILRFDGVAYPKGLGVHSRTVLEYVLEGEYQTFATRVAIQGSLEKKGDADVFVVGDGRKLFKGRVKGESELEIVLPLHGVKRLRLETDYGEDGVDMGDHVNWIGARLVRPAQARVKASVEAEGEGE